MIKRLSQLAAQIWYKTNGIGLLLWPLSKVFEAIVWLRRECYLQGGLQDHCLAGAGDRGW